MKFYLTLFITFGLLFFSCDKEKNNDLKTSKDTISRSEHLSMAIVWFQKSAENRALLYQTYKLAKLMLEKNIKDHETEKPLAVVTDIDETVLDNSPYNAQLIEKNILFNNESWKIWVSERRAKALPGALDFCKYAENKGVEIFYISNRSDEDKEATIANLINEGFPFADEKHVLLKKESSDKTERREKVVENYEIILYLGDNLRDFDEQFGGRGEDLGFVAVDEQSEKFGSKFIVFPNPIYGEWEKAIYKGDFSLSDEEKRKIRLDILDK